MFVVNDAGSLFVIMGGLFSIEKICLIAVFSFPCFFSFSMKMGRDHLFLCDVCHLVSIVVALDGTLGKSAVLT